VPRSGVFGINEKNDVIWSGPPSCIQEFNPDHLKEEIFSSLMGHSPLSPQSSIFSFFLFHPMSTEGNAIHTE